MTSQYSINDYKEMLSALHDGELPKAEADVLFKQLNQSSNEITQELQTYWQKLQLSQHYAQGEHSMPVSSGFLQNLNQKIDEESGPATVVTFSGSERKAREKSSAFAGNDFFRNTAIAASVMFSVVFIWMFSQAPVRQAALLAMGFPADENVIATEQVAELQSVSSGWDLQNASGLKHRVGLPTQQYTGRQVSSTSDVYLSEKRIQQYMRLHANHASLNGNQGIMPFARVSSVEQF